MCEQCRKENPAGRYDFEDEDITTGTFILFLLAIPPMVAYVWIKERLNGTNKRRQQQHPRTKLTREQKKIFRDWSGR